jgi:hypothetical protein
MKTLGQSLPTTATGGKQRGNLVRFLVVVRKLTARVPHPLHERPCRLDDFRARLAARKVFFVNRHLARVYPFHHERLGCFFGVSRTSRHFARISGHTLYGIGEWHSTFAYSPTFAAAFPRNRLESRMYHRTVALDRRPVWFVMLRSLALQFQR